MNEIDDIFVFAESAGYDEGLKVLARIIAREIVQRNLNSENQSSENPEDNFIYRTPISPTDNLETIDCVELQNMSAN